MTRRRIPFMTLERRASNAIRKHPHTDSSSASLSKADGTNLRQLRLAGRQSWSLLRGEFRSERIPQRIAES
jgi:hypothetical protein